MKFRKTFKSKFWVNHLPIIISILVLLFSFATVLGSYFFIPKDPNNPYPEVTQLKGAKMKFAQLKSYFQALANKKGALYAYEVLKRAELPPGTDMHLMGHVVGDILYLQKGAAGMKYCTQDFRNACSHTIVVGLLLDKGEQALNEITENCKDAPGGSGAFFMCFHGLGHGVLAYSGYDFPKAIGLCKKVGTEKNNFQEYGECVGGMVMEQISGGDHDKTTWRKMRAVNLRPNDRLYPCNSEIVSDQIAKTFCYLYITPYLLGTAETGIPKLTNDGLRQSFSYCETIPDGEERNKQICFSGFGKEFVVLAKERDIRNIDKMREDELGRVYAWCSLAKSKLGQDNCLEGAVNSLFWGGENDPVAAITFCSLLPGEQRQNCFNHLVGQARRYLKNPDQFNIFCDKLPTDYYPRCASY